MPNDDTLVVKGNDLVEARYKLSLGEQRLILLLASTIQKNDIDFNTYEIRVADFAEMFNLKTDKSLYEKVEKISEELLGKKLYLKNNGKDFEATVWLSYVKYTRGEGVITLRFDESLKPYLLQLNQRFTQYKLNTVMNFKSSYSIRLYELLIKDVWIPKKEKKNNFEKFFTIEEYRETLGVEKGLYPIFADFRKRVIEPTVREITDNTDLNIFEVRYVKTGRKITGIHFIVLIRSEAETSAQIAQLQIGEEPKEKPDIHPAIQSLMNYGFTFENAKSYKNKYGVRQIERNIAYMLAEDKRDPIHNKAGYLSKAIPRDWGNVLEVEEQKKKERETQKQAEAEKKRLQELEEQRQAEELRQRNLKAIETFLSLPNGMKNLIKKGFIETIQDNSFKLERWNKTQALNDDSTIKNEPLIRGDFARYLIDNSFFE